LFETTVPAPKYRRAIAIGVVLLVAVAVAVCVSKNMADNPTPPAASTPVAVVAADYLKAAKAQNCGLTRELTTSDTWAWCDRPRMLSYSGVQKPYSCRNGEGSAKDWCVAFTMKSTTDASQSISTDLQRWTYYFARTKAGWRLIDQGFD
jgi:hypothetical protein